MRGPIGRVVAFVVALGVAFLAGTVLVWGVFGAGCCSGWSYVQDPDADPSESMYIPDPPFEIEVWLRGSIFMIGALSIFLAMAWLAWWAIQPKRAQAVGDTRWAARTRIFVWAWLIVVTAFFSYAGIMHATNWAEWHGLLAERPDIPHEPDPSQVSTGTAMVLGAIAVVGASAAWLKRRRKL